MSLISSIKDIEWTRYKWVIYLVLILFFAKTVAAILVSYVDLSLTPLSTKKVLKDKTPRILPPNISQITAFNIFYPSTVSQQKGPTDISTATRTQFPINLLGTVVFENDEKSFADLVISRSTEPITVKKNDLILNNQVKIHIIEYERVYLVNMNTQGFEYIDFPKEQEERESRPPIRSNVPERPSVGSSWEIPRDRIRDALSEKNFEKTITDAASRFEMVGGRIIGVHILSVKPGSLYEDLDIRGGDVLTSVNGRPVNNLIAATQLFEELKKNVDHIDQPISITMIRNGQPVQKTYSIK